MGLRLRRLLGPVVRLSAGEWTDESASGKTVACPACGGVSELEQAVDDAGIVQGRWTCPALGCSFRDFLSLEAWGEAVLR